MTLFQSAPATPSRLWCIVISILICAPSLASYAQATPPARLPVTVALVDSLPPGDGFAVVHRHFGTGSRDVIVLDARRANGQLLASAVFQLLIAQQAAPSSNEAPRRLRMTTAVVPKAWEHGERVRAAHMVNRLRLAPKVNVPGLGSVRTIELRIRADALRGRLSGQLRGGQ